MPDEQGSGGILEAVRSGPQGIPEIGFQTTITESAIEQSIRESNRKNRLVEEIFAFGAHEPSVVTWQEMYDVATYAMVSNGSEPIDKLQEIIAILAERLEKGLSVSKK